MEFINNFVTEFKKGTLRNLVKEGDYYTIRNTFISHWILFTLIGTILGIELVRRGLIPL